MKRYYWLFIVFILWLTAFLVMFFRYDLKLSDIFWKKINGGVVSFSYSNYSSWGFGEGYEVYIKDDIPYLKISISNLVFRSAEFSGVDKINDWVYVETFELDPNILEEMQKLAKKHKIWRREGDYRNTKILDGDSWEFFMKFWNWNYISAHGYMASPRGFYKGLEEFLAPFVDKYAQTKEKADALLREVREY